MDWEVVHGSMDLNTRPEREHALIQKIFVRGGPTMTAFYYSFAEGREDPNTTISGPSSARQRISISMAFRWRADDGPTLNAGLLAL